MEFLQITYLLTYKDGKSPKKMYHFCERVIQSRCVSITKDCDNLSKILEDKDRVQKQGLLDHTEIDCLYLPFLLSLE